MAAKGNESKTILFNKIKEIYPNSFWEEENKILRVPFNENGTRVELKISLTAAKTNLGGDNVESAFSSESISVQSAPQKPMSAFDNDPPANNDIEPSEEEKANVERLIKALNF